MKYLLIIILLIGSTACFGQKSNFAQVQQYNALNKAKDSIAKADSVEYITNNDLKAGIKFLQDNLTVTEYTKFLKLFQGYNQAIQQSAINRKKKK